MGSAVHRGVDVNISPAVAKNFGWHTGLKNDFLIWEILEKPLDIEIFCFVKNAYRKKKREKKEQKNFW